MPRKYSLQRIGNLLTLRATVSGIQGTRALRLLLDTGSTYTILPNEVLSSIGLDPFASKERVRIVTGSGYLVVPRVQVQRFDCLGYKLKGFKVVGHTIPPDSFVDGLLGMDFLVQAKAVIDTGKGEIEVSSEKQ